MKDNFTFSDNWINSIYYRYDINKIEKNDILYFYNYNGLLKCQNYFDYNINNNILNGLLKYSDIKFSYFDNEKALKKLEEWCINNNYKLKIEDKWEAPILKLNTSLENYIKDSNSKQLKRNYNLYKNKVNRFEIKRSNNLNIVELWKDVLLIDNNSWKKRALSDMKSLDREDLQYFPYMINNQDNISLFVLYEDGIPLSYSLMFKSKNEWYQAKWGSSDEGRKKYCGFIVLFNHIEYIYDLSPNIIFDFWGRRNETYDRLKNGFKRRYHILLSKE